MFPGQNLISQMLPASRDIRRFQQQQQQQQQMGGGGYQNSVNPDYARPAGPDALGLGPAQDRSNWRDALNSMPPALSFGLGMVPGIGTALGLARAANYGLSQQEASQLAPSRDMREQAQDTFRASEISAGNGYGGFGGDTGGADTMGFGGEYSHGGRVQLKDLIQPGPGKDDGYGGLQDGEYVIKKDAVKKYGIKMLENINQRKVSKKQVSNFFKNHG
jgi:hypothetical protein